MKKVVLFLPPYSGQPLGPPAGLLCLASPLIQAGYRVTIVDAAVTPDYLTEIERETSDALCFGVSLLTGPMIRGAVKAARHVRNVTPHLPIIFGGWHPSLLPEQTLREPFVDVVVRHQGELTLLELVQRIESGHSLEGLAGCSYKSADQVRHNAARPIAGLNHLPFPAYELADFDAYERAGGIRKLPFASSVGCPYACNYCTDTVFYNRRFNAYDARRVVEGVSTLVDRHRIKEVAFLDSNFLVDTRRALEIARGFLESGPGFQWTFQASTDLLCRLSLEQVSLLGKSGVRHIGFGVESGSEDVLLRMNKHHQRIHDLFETAAKCRDAGIRPTFNLILGFPGETEADRWETLNIMGEIASRFDNVTFSPNVFTPYPGIPIWPELRRRGVKEPQALEEWATFALGTNVLPWMKGSVYRNVKRSMFFFMLNNEVSRAAQHAASSRLTRAVLRAVQKPLHWRMRKHFFGWPLELWLLRARNRFVMCRSLLTGEALGHGMGETC